MIDTSNYKIYRGFINDQTYFLELDSTNVNRLLDRAHFKVKLGDYQGAIDDYSRAIKLENNVSYYYARCMYYRDFGKYELSNMDLDTLLKLDSNFTYKPKEKYILFKGYNYLDIGDYQLALDAFNTVLEINPNNPKAYNNRGMAKYYLDDFEGALEDQNIAVKLDPNYPQAYGKRGDTKFMLGDYIGALIDLNKAVILDPFNMSVYSNRAGTKVALEDYEGALEDCNIALMFDPNNVNVLNHRASAYFGLKMFAKAEADLVRVEELKRSLKEKNIEK